MMLTPTMSPPIHQKNIHELIMSSLHNHCKTSHYLLQVGMHGFEDIRLLWPCLPGKVTKLLFSTPSKTLRINSAPAYREAEFWTLVFPLNLKIILQNTSPSFFCTHCTVCRILVPWLGIELGPSAVKAWSPNHWTAREFPRDTSFKEEEDVGPKSEMLLCHIGISLYPF